jgi:diacylglycerol O-acyltransferase / wax synthase
VPSVQLQGRDQALNPADQAFVAMDRGNSPMNMSVLVKLDGSRGSLEDWRRYLDSRLDRVPRWRQRVATLPLGIGRPVWVDDREFDIANHVRGVRLDLDGDDVLYELAARLHGARQSMRHSPWLITVVDQPSRQSLAIRAHHVLADGIGSVEIGQAIFDLAGLEPGGAGAAVGSAGAAAPEEGAEAEESDDPSAPGEGLRADIAQSVEVARSLASDRMAMVPRVAETVRRLPSRLQARALAGVLDVAKGVVTGPVLALGSPFARRVGPGRHFEGLHLPLDQVKRIKDAAGCKVNDVVLAIVASGARSVFDLHGLPDRSHLRIAVPVDVRQPEDPTFGNYLSVRRIEAPISPIPSLAHVSSVADAGRASIEGEIDLSFHEFLNMAELLPPLAVRTIARAVARLPLFDVFVSNVPGPPPLSVRGAKVVDIIGNLPPGPRTPIAVCACSYDGKMSISVVADDRGQDDASTLRDAMAAAFDELRAQADERLAPPAKGRSNRPHPAPVSPRS